MFFCNSGYSKLFFYHVFQLIYLQFQGKFRFEKNAKNLEDPAPWVGTEFREFPKIRFEGYPK